MWELLYLLCLDEGPIYCKVINTATKAYLTSVMMLPFAYNIYVIYASFPEELHQVSLSEWTMGQLRNGMIMFMMKSFQEVLGEKPDEPSYARSLDPIISSSVDSVYDTRETRPISESPLLGRPEVDSADRVHTICVKSECVISDYLIDYKQGDQRDCQDECCQSEGEVKLVELAPKIFQEIRRAHGATNKNVVEAFCVKKYKEGKMVVNVQKSNKDETLMILSSDSLLLLKTMPEDEYKNLKDNVMSYFAHINSHPDTLLCAALGVFSLHFPAHLCIEPLHFYIAQTVTKSKISGTLRFFVSVSISPPASRRTTTGRQPHRESTCFARAPRRYPQRSSTLRRSPTSQTSG